MNPEDVRKTEMLIAQKRSQRTMAEKKTISAETKLKNGDLQGAKQDLHDARGLIQQALAKVRILGERGTSERCIKDDIECLWREIEEKERQK